MLVFKKILCSTDFSEPSYVGLKAAIDMVRTYSAQLILVHVVESIPTSAAPIGDHSGIGIAVHQKMLRETAEQSLSQLIEQKIPKGLSVQPMVAEGDPAHQISKMADNEGVDLVVIATHGRTGWRHVVYGSVAERVVRLAKPPVLTIRTPEQVKLPKEMYEKIHSSELEPPQSVHPDPPQD